MVSWVLQNCNKKKGPILRNTILYYIIIWFESIWRKNNNNNTELQYPNMCFHGTHHIVQNNIVDIIINQL